MLFSSFALCHIQNLSSRQSKSLGSFNCFQIANRQFSSIEQYNAHTQSKKKLKHKSIIVIDVNIIAPLSPRYGLCCNGKRKREKRWFLYIVCVNRVGFKVPAMMSRWLTSSSALAKHI